MSALFLGMSKFADHVSFGDIKIHRPRYLGRPRKVPCYLQHGGNHRMLMSLMQYKGTKMVKLTFNQNDII